MEKAAIICVDDEKFILQSLRSHLLREFRDSFIIETAESGEEGLEVFNELLEENCDIPLVISDQIMIGMNGDEFLAKIHKISPKTYKVMLTGKASIEAIANAVNNASLYRFIPKPWDETDIILTVRESLKSYYLEREVEKYKKELEDKHHQLEVKNRNIRASIRHALTIQRAILPSVELIKLKFDCFILYKPRDIVSGDFYFYHESINNNNYYKFISVVDCTGHGVPGAIMSMISSRLLKEAINESLSMMPADILERLDYNIRKALRQDENENREGMDLTLCRLEQLDKGCELIYSSAKRPVYIYDSQNEGRINQYTGDRRSIGGIAGKTRVDFTNKKIILNYGDIVYLATDGYSDQNNLSRKKFGRGKFLAMLQTICDMDLSEQKEILESVLKEYMEEAEQRDDITVLGLKII